jgi:hypothetical protein
VAANGNSHIYAGGDAMHAIRLDQVWSFFLSNAFQLITCSRSLGEFQQLMHVELMQELNSTSQIEVMWAVQFFAQVIVKLEGGPQAFINAQSPDAMLALDMATSLNFFNVHTREGPQPYIWDDARNVLLQYPETSRHPLLAILELRRNSPSHFLASRGFLENDKHSKKQHGKVEKELKIVSPHP